MARQILSTNTFTIAKYIASSVSGTGTNTTLSGAYTDASSGETIFLRNNPTTATAKAGVNLAGASNLYGTAGGWNFNTAGTFSVGNAAFYNAGGAGMGSVSSSNLITVYLGECYFSNNNVFFDFPNTNASTVVNIYNSRFFLTGTLGYTFRMAGSLTLNFINCVFQINSSTTTDNNTSSGSGKVNFYGCTFFSPITTSSTSSFAAYNCLFDTSRANITALTLGGSGTNLLYKCTVRSGTASAISIGSAATLIGCGVNSSNTNAVTGAGTLTYSGLCLSSSSGVNTTTITRKVMDGGEYKGRNVNTAPTAGTLGEQIRSAIASGSAVALTSATPANVTSISLTAGIWDVSGIIQFTGTPTGGTPYFSASVTTTSATEATLGDNASVTPTPPISGADNSLSVPPYRISLSGTTTVYLVGRADFTTSTCSAYGRISATRVS